MLSMKHIFRSDAIDRKLIATHKVIPLNKRGNRLSVAIADPTNLRALDEIRFQTGLAVDPIVVEHPKLAPLVAKYAESAAESLKNFTSDDINLDFLDEEAAAKADDASWPGHRRCTGRQVHSENAARRD
jgi:type IV pilus assembly protein PilB